MRTRLIFATDEQLADKEFLLKAHKFDPNEFEFVSAKSKIWNAYSKQDGLVELYSSQLTVKPKSKNISICDISEIIKSLEPKPIPYFTPTHYGKGKIAVVNVADLHFGKLGWNGECGENFDHKIATDRYYTIINDVVEYLKKCKYEKIIFVWSNDFFHFDTIHNTTTAGTPQDTDLRLKKLAKLGFKLLVDGCTTLSQLAPVETMYLGSNHDELISFFATLYLDAWFRETDTVTIDDGCQTRKYKLYGNTLIGYTHGEKMKAERLFKLMPLEAPELWAKSKYREWNTAHLHKESMLTDEDTGIIIRKMSSPTGTDNWHYKSGFVGAVKKAQTFIYDEKLGNVDIHHTVLEV